MNNRKNKSIYVILSVILIFCNINIVPASATEKVTYKYSETASSGNVTLKVEWNEPKLGQPTTFHVSATGGSGNYMFRMDAPSYSSPNENLYESVADPSRGEWTKYTKESSYCDYNFTMTATGTYNFRFYLMDKDGGVYYLRTNTFIKVESSEYPSVNTIINSAVSKCNTETDGTDYAKALWLHDWLLEQLDYDKSLKWSSAESALTRGLGTCQAYESAYAKLLTAANIENSETRDVDDGHTWNAIKLDGEWYQVDCTWDDSDGEWYNFDQRHLYFALTDELMAIAHTGHKNIYTASDYATPSNSLKDNYFVKNGEALKWAENYKERIQNKLDSKETTFIISADNASFPISISGIQNGIIAYAINQINWSDDDTNIQLSVVGDATDFKFSVTYKDNKKPEHKEHIWDDGVLVTVPTCTKDGLKTYKCSICGQTKEDVIKAKGHSWDTGKVIKEPTYEEEGIRQYTCLNCNTTKTQSIEVLKHNPVTLEYKTHVEDYGWQNFVSNGELSGTTGESKRLEAIVINLTNDYNGTIEYQTHVEDYGWQDWVSNGELSGTTGQSKRLEAIRIKLTDELEDNYDIYYRVHCQDFGWLGWAKNGEASGSEGFSKRLEAIEIIIVEKGIGISDNTVSPFLKNEIKYRTHIQDIGWQGYVSNGQLSGTTGISKRIEAINIKLPSEMKGTVEYQAHIEDIGWQNWVSNGELSGTEGQSKRLEAIRIKLGDGLENQFDIYYRVHCQDLGWLEWVKNGKTAGTEGMSKRIEAIEIQILPKGTIEDDKNNSDNDYYVNFANMTADASSAEIIRGVDVSKHKAEIDWKQVANAGYKFAMVRAAGRYTDDGGLFTDQYYQHNITGASNNGMKVGVYFFSQAITVEEAREEANYLISLIKNYNITYPVVFDWETTKGYRTYNKLDKDSLTSICEAFCEVIKDAGYQPMIYMNKNTWLNSVNYDVLASKYNVWLAWYFNKYYYDGKDYETGDELPEELPFSYNMWQYTDNGTTVPGINGDVDLDLAFIKR